MKSDVMKARETPKATLYGVGIFGLVFKKEGRLHSHGRTDSIAANQLRDYGGQAPWVAWLDKGKRNPNFFLRTSIHRYLLVLAGLGHPDPLIQTTYMDDSNVRKFDDFIRGYIGSAGVEVLVDYRDSIRDSNVGEAA